MVGVVIGAQRIAVDHRGGRVFDVRGHRLLAQLHPSAGAVLGAQHEVPVAVEKENPRAALGQLAQVDGDRFGQVVSAVVADPDLEQVTENVERVGPASRAAQKVTQETPGLRAACLEVQVRDDIEQGITQGARPVR